MLVLKLLIVCLLVLFTRSDVSPVEKHPNFHLLPMDICGPIANISSKRIIDGTEAVPGEFPWIVLIHGIKGDSHSRCGGSIITSNYILTAAHCIEKGYTINIHLGEHNIGTDPDCYKGKCQPKVQIQEGIKYEDVIVHPQYDVSHNDIALIRLKKPIDFNADNLKPICLPIKNYNEDILVEKPGIVAGWGRDENGKLPSYLKKARITMLDVEFCKKRINGTFIQEVPYEFICTIASDGSGCEGDSGGPLISVHEIGNTKRYVQEGTVAFGGESGCVRKVGEEAFTNVGKYLTWILDNIKP